MPVVVDLRSWGGHLLAADTVARRVAALIKFIAPEASSRVAVLTRDPAAVTAEVEGLHRGQDAPVSSLLVHEACGCS
jgi:hypothetical protein